MRAPVASSVSLEEKIEWLSTPDAYPARPPRVELIETHFAYVFLAGARAYKLKKPALIHGVDLSRLAERERRCREELIVNRRLAAPTYLGLVALVRRGRELVLAGTGTAVEWLVEMRALDRAQMLDARLAAGSVRPADWATLVAHLRSLDPPALAGRAAAPGGPDPGVRFRLEEALREVARPEFELAPADHRVLAGALRAAYADLVPQLAGRAARVRDGHGDLRAEHVWLGHPLQIIDALEFDPGLRWLDPAEDVAMLAVDVERCAGAAAREALCAAYEAVAGDALAPALWSFYLALRAVTRAKVALWHMLDPRPSTDATHWQRRALDYLGHAARLLELR
ncbi:MAG TPA: hypothetical protein VMT92_11730 [Steroidobacteraceae bacterium]|nr:hypothetical protein [Steroidobacteraceae bacterium]